MEPSKNKYIRSSSTHDLLVRMMKIQDSNNFQKDYDPFTNKSIESNTNRNTLSTCNLNGNNFPATEMLNPLHKHAGLNNDEEEEEVDTIIKPELITNKTTGPPRYTWKLKLIDICFVCLILAGLIAGLLTSSATDSSTSSSSIGSIGPGISTYPSPSSHYTILNIEYNVTNKIIDSSSITSLRCNLGNQLNISISQILLISWTEANTTVIPVTVQHPLNNGECSTGNRRLIDSNQGIAYNNPENPVTILISITLFYSTSRTILSSVDILYLNTNNTLITNNVLKIYQNNIYIPPVGLRTPTATRLSSASRTPSMKKSSSPSSSSTMTISYSSSFIVSSNNTPSPSCTPSVTPTISLSSSITSTPSSSSTMSSTPSPSSSITPTISVTPSITPTISITPSPPLGAIWTKGDTMNNWISIAASANFSRMIATLSKAGQSSLYTSVDGKNWTIIPNTQNYWGTGSVAVSANGTILAAVASAGSIYISTNGGISWNTFTPGSGFGYVVMSSDANIIYVTKNGNSATVLKSMNYGNSWTTLSPVSNSWSSIACSANGTRVAIVESGSGGRIYLSDNLANTFITSAPTGSFVSVAMSADGLRIAVAQLDGNVLISNNFGASWVSKNISSSLSSISMSYTGQYLIAADSNPSSYTRLGYLYTSNDFGVTWTSRGTSARWSSAIISADGMKLAAAEYTGYIYTSG